MFPELLINELIRYVCDTVIAVWSCICATMLPVPWNAQDQFLQREPLSVARRRSYLTSTLLLFQKLECVCDCTNIYCCVAVGCTLRSGWVNDSCHSFRWQSRCSFSFFFFFLFFKISLISFFVLFLSSLTRASCGRFTAALSDLREWECVLKIGTTEST